MSTEAKTTVFRRISRRSAMRAGGGLAAGLGGAALALGAGEGAVEAGTHAAVGSWITYVHLDDGDEDIHMMTLAPGGILLFSGESPLIPSPVPGMEEFWWNPGHGAWQPGAESTVAGHFVVIVQDRNQQPAFFAHVRCQLRPQGPDALGGRFTFAFVPVGASEAVVTFGATVEATRVRV